MPEAGTGEHQETNPVTGVDIAVMNAQNESALREYDAENQKQIEMFRATITSGQAALKSAILINGGASVALLAFIGNIWTKGTLQEAVDSLTLSIGLFAGGVLAAAIASGNAYLAQYCYNRYPKWAGDVLNVITILLVIASYVLFAWGTYESYSAFAVHLPIESVPQ